MSLQGSSPLLLDRTLRRTSASPRSPRPGSLVERVEIFPDRSPDFGESGPVDRLGAISRALLVRIRLDQAGIEGEAFTANKTFLDAAPDRRLEQLEQ
jgi:hypothetical protein